MVILKQKNIIHYLEKIKKNVKNTQIKKFIFSKNPKINEKNKYCFLFSK